MARTGRQHRERTLRHDAARARKSPLAEHQRLQARIAWDGQGFAYDGGA